jgi:hypothetical protein
MKQPSFKGSGCVQEIFSVESQAKAGKTIRLLQT